MAPGLKVVVALGVATTGGKAILAQDKPASEAPNGRAFSEFTGYQDWQVVAVSQTENAIAVILANPVMIAAYRAGGYGEGKPFPDGAKMAKIHWMPTKSADAPAPTMIPGALHDVISWSGTARDFRTPADGDTSNSTMTPRRTDLSPRGAA
jgi:hypothetical protein